MSNISISKNKAEDAYCVLFAGSEYGDLKKEQEALETESTWTEAAKLAVLPMAEPMDAHVYHGNPGCNVPLDVLMETTENAGIMLEADGNVTCIRNCALPSLLTTAGISGGGVSRVTKAQLATGLTAFLTGARSRSKILIRAGKVAAVVSLNYQCMPISELLQIVDGLKASFGEPTFEAGLIEHGLTVAQFRYDEAAADVTAAYQRAISGYGRQYGKAGNWTPVIQFRASDTSTEAAKLLVFLRNGSVLLPVGGVSVAHVEPRYIDPGTGLRQTNFAKFKEETESVYAKMLLQIDAVVPEMLNTHIDHPGNTFVGLCRYAGIPQKWGGSIEEDIRTDYPDGSDCTFLDLYEQLTSVTALAIKDGLTMSSKKLLDMEEGICKIANNTASWKRFDLPGTVAWSGTRNN